MSGYVTAMSACYNCGRIFSFNPHRVPSITPAGKSYQQREPICRSCILAANTVRIRNGLPPIEILPDAYEPISEEEL